tara:strand:- start:9116 stop:9361 length:246 start_codon:yes stop_codon:yes gene_type:complete
MTRHLTPLGRALALILLAVALFAAWRVVPHPPLPAVRISPGFVPGILTGVVATVAAQVLLAVLAWALCRRALFRALHGRSF